MYLARDVSGEVAVGRKLEVAGVLGPVIGNFNVPRLKKKRSQGKITTFTHKTFIVSLNAM